MPLLVSVLVVLLSACGASSVQIKTAKAAQYDAPVATIFELAKSVASENYVVDGQPAPTTFSTKWQWYAKEGGRQSAGAGGLAQVSEGSVNLSLSVEVTEVAGGKVAVVITPNVLQLVTGSPKPRQLAPTDPEMPPWVHGRVDELAVAIYERAKQYAQKP